MSQMLSRLSSWRDKPESITEQSIEAWVAKKWRSHSARVWTVVLRAQTIRAPWQYCYHIYTIEMRAADYWHRGVSYERHSLNDHKCSPTAGAAGQQDAKGRSALAHMARDGTHVRRRHETPLRSAFDVAKLPQLISC